MFNVIYNEAKAMMSYNTGHESPTAISPCPVALRTPVRQVCATGALPVVTKGCGKISPSKCMK